MLRTTAVELLETLRWWKENELKLKLEPQLPCQGCGGRSGSSSRELEEHLLMAVVLRLAGVVGAENSNRQPLGSAIAITTNDKMAASNTHGVGN